MQISRLKTCVLLKGARTKANNGTYVNTYQEQASYSVIPQELTDEVSASIYGANINKTTRISSVRRELEALLKTKLNNKADNISNYAIEFENKIHKIVSVKNNWVDIEASNEIKDEPYGSV